MSVPVSGQPDPLVMPEDEFAALKAVAAVLCPRCLHDGVLERTLARAEAAEAKLAEVRAVLLEGGQDHGTVRRRALAITDTEEPGDGD